MAKKDKKAVQEAPVQEIDPILLSKVGALKAIVTIHSLLHEGNFQVQTFPAIQSSLEFLKSLHKQVVGDALQHPQAEQVPELKQLKGDQ